MVIKFNFIIIHILLYSAYSSALSKKYATCLYYFLFLGLGLGAFMPSAMNLIYKFASGGDNKIYMALTDTALAPFTFIAITIVGVLAKLLKWKLY